MNWQAKGGKAFVLLALHSATEGGVLNDKHENVPFVDLIIDLPVLD